RPAGRGTQRRPDTAGGGPGQACGRPRRGRQQPARTAPEIASTATAPLHNAQGAASAPAKRQRAMSRILDVKGLYCPEPVLRTKLAMRALPPGETLTVLATDPAAVIDFTCYCDRAGLELLSVRKEPGLL